MAERKGSEMELTLEAETRGKDRWKRRKERVGRRQRTEGRMGS